MSSSRWVALIGLLFGLATPVACSGGTVCGEGTVLQDGACVLSPPEPTCAPGTTFDRGSLECRGEVRCGPGTTRDPRTGACTSDSSCGAGTTLNETTGTCVADVTCGVDTRYDPISRTCMPLLECGAGTAYDAATQSCLPSVQCGVGTVFQPLTGSCVATLQCGIGLIAHAGTCMAPADVLLLDPDVVEGTPDDNDPDRGGDPEPAFLPDTGGSITLAGVIGRLFDEDGDQVQDRDVWRFYGQVGQVVRVRVLSDGLPNPGFRITGPDGYLRTAPLGVVEQPERLLVLTKAGFFDLEISTRAAILDASPTPFGASDFGYVAVLETLPLPTAVEILAGPAPGTSASGDLINLQGNVITVRANGPRPLALHVEADQTGTEPVALLFDAGGRLLRERKLTAQNGRLVTGLAAYNAGGFVTLVIDWEESDGLDGTFDVRATVVPEVDLGVLSAGGLREAPRADLAFDDAAAFSVTVNSGDVIEVDPFGAQNMEIAVLLPNGRLTTAFDSGTVDVLPIVPAASGPLRVMLLSRSTTFRQAQVAFRAHVAQSTGMLDGPLAAPVVFSGTNLFPRRQLSDHAFVAVPHSLPLVIEGMFTARFGIPRVLLHRLDDDGVVFSSRTMGAVDWQHIAVLRETAGRVLFEVDLEDSPTSDPDPPVIDWQLVVDARSASIVNEDEPNDTTAEALPASGRVEGSLTPRSTGDDEDTFSFTLSPPLAANEVLDVQVTGVNNSSSVLTLRGLVGGQERFETATAAMTAWTILPQDGPGPWIVSLTSGSNEAHSYVLETFRRTADVEVEPNDAPAQPVGTAPLSRIARVAGADVDWFSATLTDAVALVRVRNLTDTTDLTVTVRDSVGAIVAGPSEHEDAQLTVTRPLDGVIVIEVVGDGASADDLYRVSVEPLIGAELEPNNDAASAHAVVLSDHAAVFGNERKRSSGLTSDFVRFTPSAPLAEGECWLVRWYNLTDDTDLIVRVSEETAPGAPTLLAEGDVSVGELALATAGDLLVEVSVDGLAARADSWLLEVERAPAVAEQEPNDALTLATPLLLGATARGQSRGDDADLFEVSTAPGARVAVSARSLLTMKELGVRALDGEGNVLTAAQGLDPSLTVVVPGASLLVEVTGSSTATGAVDPYVLVAEPAP